MEDNGLSGQILRNFRLEYGLSQKAVAEQTTLAGVPCCERHYRRLEHNQMVPSVLLAMAICHVLDADVYEVFG